MKSVTLYWQKHNKLMNHRPGQIHPKKGIEYPLFTDKLALGYILGILLLGSCSTLPPLPQNQAEILSILPQSSDIFISLQNTPENQTIWKRFTSTYASENKRIAEALSQTRGLSLAVRREGAINQNYLILQGRYPGCWINWGLWWDSAWHEIPSHWGSYWQESSSHLKIKTLGDRLLMITTGNMEELLQDLSVFSEKNPPPTPDLSQQINNSPLFLYFPFFSKSAYSNDVPINQKRLPIDEVWLSMTIDQKLYEIESCLSLNSEEDANLFIRSFKTFLLWLRREASIENFVKRTEVVVRGNKVFLQITKFSEDEVNRGIDLFQENKEATFVP